MKPYADALSDPNASKAIRRTGNWIEHFICRPNRRQKVVGNRRDNAGIAVTQPEFDQDSPAAHVCPFVQESLTQRYLWLEESPLSPANVADIEALLISQIRLFKATSPIYDPIVAGQGAAHPTYLKTFLTIFPAFSIVISNAKAQYPLIIDPLYSKLRDRFIAEGLMLGQFYPGCIVAAVYNPAWNNPGPLIAPYPSFAIRYMAHHDHLFIRQGTPAWQTYKSLFP